MARGCPGFITVVFAVLMTATTSHAEAADIRVVAEREASHRAIAIEGLIEAGDFDEFIRLVRDHQAIASVYLFSSGGDFAEAMRIGRAIRALELSSRVPARARSGGPVCDGQPGAGPVDRANCTCASACFFIHVAATHREGDYLAVHRPYFPGGEFGRLSQKDAMKAFDVLQRLATEFMDDMGVPKHVQEDVLGTPSDRTLVLDDRTVKTYFHGDLPYRDEWTRNRCSKLTADERAQLAWYSERQAGEGSAADARAAEREPANLRDLQNRRGEELECVVAVQEESRRDAHERFFGRQWHK